LKSCCVLQDHDERNNTVFHNTTTSDLQDQDQDHSIQNQEKTIFLVSERSCPKTDGLRPHHWHTVVKCVVIFLCDYTFACDKVLTVCMSV